MAKRINPELTDAWRDRIRVSQIINRLMKHVMGKNKMSSTQISAAALLLRKVIPDLSTLDALPAPPKPKEALDITIKEAARRLAWVLLCAADNKVATENQKMADATLQRQTAEKRIE